MQIPRMDVDIHRLNLSLHSPSCVTPKLGYHENDYYSDSGFEYMNSNEPNHLFSKPASNLYNGNISNWEISYHKDLVDATGGEVKHRFGNTYRYDVLGRLTSNTFYEADQNSSSYTTGFTQPTNADYSTIMNYDPNGNFNNLERRGPANSGGTDAAMDNIEYNYYGGTNKLEYATDYVGKSFTTDLGIQHPGNYSYTELGELEYDLSESSTITWTPDGKVKRIDLGDGNYTAIEFYYDARGDRVAKIGRSSSTNSPIDTYTVYHRDAAGNVLAIYDNSNGEQEGEEEWLCVEFKGECYWVTDLTRTVCFAPGKWYEDGDKVVLEDFYLEHPLCPPSPGYYNSVTFSKALMDDIGGDPALPAPTKIASYHKEVRFKSGFSEEVNLSEWHLYGSSAQGRVATVKPDGIEYANSLEESATFGYLVRELSEKFFEVKDHLGNVRLVFSDLKKVEADPTRKPYKLDLTAVNNYYPFGMLMPENNWQSGLSRYGFNGFEQDNEVKGTGNHIAFGDYGYDTRLGRRWQIEPKIKEFPSLSSYSVFNDNPILYNDPNGLLWKLSMGRNVNNQDFETFISRSFDNKVIASVDANGMVSIQLSGNNTLESLTETEKHIFNLLQDIIASRVTVHHKVEKDRWDSFIDSYREKSSDISGNSPGLLDIGDLDNYNNNQDTRFYGLARFGHATYEQWVRKLKYGDDPNGKSYFEAHQEAFRHEEKYGGYKMIGVSFKGTYFQTKDKNGNLIDFVYRTGTEKVLIQTSGNKFLNSISKIFGGNWMEPKYKTIETTLINGVIQSTSISDGDSLDKNNMVNENGN